MDDEAEAPEPTEYDRRAAAWVRRRYPGADPDPGSVELATDCAGYASGGWSRVEVSWSENGRPAGKTLFDDAWQADLTEVIRELVDMPLDGEGT